MPPNSTGGFEAEPQRVGRAFTLREALNYWRLPLPMKKGGTFRELDSNKANATCFLPVLAAPGKGDGESEWVSYPVTYTRDTLDSLSVRGIAPQQLGTNAVVPYTPLRGMTDAMFGFVLPTDITRFSFVRMRPQLLLQLADRFSLSDIATDLRLYEDNISTMLAQHRTLNIVFNNTDDAIKRLFEDALHGGTYEDWLAWTNIPLPDTIPILHVFGKYSDAVLSFATWAFDSVELGGYKSAFGTSEDRYAFLAFVLDAFSIDVQLLAATAPHPAIALLKNGDFLAPSFFDAAALAERVSSELDFTISVVNAGVERPPLPVTKDYKVQIGPCRALGKRKFGMQEYLFQGDVDAMECFIDTIEGHVTSGGKAYVLDDKTGLWTSDSADIKVMLMARRDVLGKYGRNETDMDKVAIPPPTPPTFDHLSPSLPTAPLRSSRFSTSTSAQRAGRMGSTALPRAACPQRTACGTC